jgi:hypothetical protein
MGWCNKYRLIHNGTDAHKISRLRLRETKYFQRVFGNRYVDNSTIFLRQIMFKALACFITISFKKFLFTLSCKHCVDVYQQLRAMDSFRSCLLVIG